KQTLTYHAPTAASTASRIDQEVYDRCLEHFEKGEYTSALHALLDYIDPELRARYGNPAGTEFKVPHGSIIVGIRIDGDRLEIDAPFLGLPEKGRIPLLRQIAGLNTNVLDLSCILLRDKQFHFTYDCPLALTHPAKIYDVLYEICRTSNLFYDEFVNKYGAQRICEPEVKPYDAETVERIYNEIQQTCTECLDAVKGFETELKYGYAWNVLASALLEIVYSAHPQGQLLNELNKAISEHDREDIPIQEVIARGKEAVQKIAGISREQLAGDLYFVETFVSDKRSPNLKNLQDNFEKTFDKATAALNSDNTMACCVLIVYKFYEMYYYNNVQDDVNAIVSEALRRTSAMPWDQAAPILHAAMKKIMEGEPDTGRFDLQRDDKLPETIFKERTLTDLTMFCEEAIADMGVDPVPARVGPEAWKFHQGSSEIWLFVYQRSYLFCTSPINVLPKKELEPVLTYLVSEDLRPYKLGIEDNQIYIAYRIHISDIFSGYADQVKKNITGLAFKADELNDYLAETYGCEFSEYAKKDAI
ncbi:MAG: YbjN domain-containing protein, partial [Rikenellaceae bacterium]|nr:YbjN domain-containing protein [Rikenellaceae bacterium]